MSAITIERPVLSGRPNADLKLPDVHAELLALISAHKATLDRALPWSLLLRYVDVVAFEGPHELVLDEILEHKNPARVVAELLGDLSDYGLIEVGRDGLCVTSAGADALAESDRRGLLDQMIKWIAEPRHQPAGLSTLPL